MRARFFGPSASTASVTARLDEPLPGEFRPRDARHPRRGRRRQGVRRRRRALELVVHAAAQPSHDWAASDPATDFTVNALARSTCSRRCAVHAPTRRSSSARRTRSTATGRTRSRSSRARDPPGPAGRPPVPRRHHVDMSIDRTLHSLFGVSKAAADLLVQEYGRYFGMPTVCFRGGCLTGPSHEGAQLHGFLSYLMRCVVAGEPYTVFGYEGKQVRDNIHAADVVACVRGFHAAPRPARSTTSAAAGPTRSRCSRRSPPASGSPAAAGLDAVATRRGPATTAGGSPTSTASGATTRSGSSPTISSAPAGDPRHQRRRLVRRTRPGRPGERADLNRGDGRP